MPDECRADEIRLVSPVGIRVGGSALIPDTDHRFTVNRPDGWANTQSENRSLGNARTFAW